jgi:nucleoside-diphosphate-sugar epimerase
LPGDDIVPGGFGLSRLLVTGANGFIGGALCHALEQNGYDVVRAVRDRENVAALQAGTQTFAVATGELGPDTDWVESIQGVDTIVHAAARVHLMQDMANDPLAAYRRVNNAGTACLARAAAKAAVRRFIYISTVKVSGERTESTPFSETDPPDPQDPYAVSKLEAEQALWEISGRTGLQVVIVRPPLVYGPGVKANFLRLIRLVDRGIPMPVANVTNRRSLLALDNLVDFLLRCIKAPAAAGETFLVADDEDLSTPDLIGRIAAHMGRKPRLVSFPPALVGLAARLVGKESEARRLRDSLQIDVSKARKVLDWTPAVTVDEELEKTVAWYMRDKISRNA